MGWTHAARLARKTRIPGDALGEVIHLLRYVGRKAENCMAISLRWDNRFFRGFVIFFMGG